MSNLIKNTKMPIVSVVIATRNRPQKLEHLLSCIKQQQLKDYECIIVDDNSSEETLSAYDLISENLDSRFAFHFRKSAGGPAQSRNTGIVATKGKYIAFCDDDDYWTRPDHLAVAVRTLERENGDFFFANMQTSIEGNVRDADWFKVLRKVVSQPVKGEADIYSMDKTQLAAFLKHRVHHANTIVVARKLMVCINSYWEKVSFAEDHDLSFRLSDAAKGVFFRTTVTADLDVTEHPSVARTYTTQDRTLFGILACIHAEAYIESPLLRKVARGNRAWRFIELAQQLKKECRYGIAYEFAWQALMLAPSSSAFKILLKLFFLKRLRRQSDQPLTTVSNRMRDRESYPPKEVAVNEVVSDATEIPINLREATIAANALVASGPVEAVSSSIGEKQSIGAPSK